MVNRKKELLYYANGIVNYYKGRLDAGDGTLEWGEMGLKTAQRYLELVEDDETTIDDLKEFWKYLEDNKSEYGGSKWTDIMIGIDYWIRNFS